MGKMQHIYNKMLMLFPDRIEALHQTRPNLDMIYHLRLFLGIPHIIAMAIKFLIQSSVSLLNAKKHAQAEWCRS